MFYGLFLEKKTGYFMSFLTHFGGENLGRGVEGGQCLAKKAGDLGTQLKHVWFIRMFRLRKCVFIVRSKNKDKISVTAL